jgi:hypothetical protein
MIDWNMELFEGTEKKKERNQDIQTSKLELISGPLEHETGELDIQLLE